MATFSLPSLGFPVWETLQTADHCLALRGAQVWEAS